DTRTVKTAGPPPIFAKSFRSPHNHVVRAGLILALRAAANVPGAGKMFQRIPVPDLTPAQNRTTVQLIMKSVSAAGRIGLFAEALPESRIIFIIRHPCGQIASQ